MTDTLSTFLISFSLIGLAEMGDKSQLVCMALAARYRHWPVLIGATLAFVLLNALAVIFGAVIASWISEQIVAIIVALMFALFGLHLLFDSADLDAPVETGRGGGHILVTTFALILVAEFGDKTQLTVAGLAARMDPLVTWLGASLALALVSVLGVWAGRSLFGRVPGHLLQRLAGILFLVFAGVAVIQLVVA